MPEILTESFCERCGTRYTFESAAPRAPRLKGLKVMSRGLKNFVMSDDSSMDEAMAAARSDTDREVTSQQLDAFHKTFNFCMTCRQYTCANCWNDADGRCLSCAPNLGHEVLPAPFPGLDAHGGFATANGTNGNGHDHNGHDELPALDAMAWPTSDLMREDDVAAADPEPQQTFDAAPDEQIADDMGRDDVLARLAAFAPVEAPEAPAVEAEIAAEPEIAAEAEPEIAAEAETEPEIAVDVVDVEIVGPAQLDPADINGRATAAAAQTSKLLRSFRPGENLDDELAAFENKLEVEATEPEPVWAVVAEPEPVVAIDVEPDAVEAVEAEAVEAEAVMPIELEPIVAAAPEPEPVFAIEPEPVAAVAIEPEPVAAVAIEPEPVAAVAVEPEPEPVAAVEPEPEPVAAVAPEPEPVVVAEPEPVAAAEPRVDVVAQPTWQIVAPEAPPADATPTMSPAPPSQPAEPVSAAAEPEWPAQPQWPSERPAAGGLPFFNRPATPSGGIEALWAESAREVTTAAPTDAVARPAGGVQPCVSCGLSLSATARFCRRCGTPQA
jgi:hypothetical protein